VVATFSFIERDGRTLLLVRDPKRVELLQAILLRLKVLNERAGRT
jgi:hypothetical protein